MKDIKYKGFWALNYEELWYMLLAAVAMTLIAVQPAVFPRWVEMLGAWCCGSLFMSQITEIRDNYRKQLEAWKK